MKHVADTRKPYSGLSRSLVIAIDVGTTFSGVSYAILEPGEIPKIHGVTRFPGQEHVAGNSKIPSILYYDKRGDLKAAGAEAENSSVQAEAEDEGWFKVELFKLRLRPRTMQLSMNGLRLLPLPPKKSPVHIFGDFLSYLYACTRSFITDTHANGASLFASVQDNLEFVLAHPNGWEGAQQSKMRRAAVWGGLVPDNNEGRMRIRFVTEGEASLHACVLSGLAADVLSNPSKNGFLIADAGGGTLDISSYAIKGTNPLVMEEIAPPDCIFAGSVFVSRRAREFFEQKLKKSQYGSPASLDHIAHRFDETTKRLFRDRKEMQFVPFGSPLDKDPSVGIRTGQLRLTGNEVANLFEPSVDAAVNAIKAQIDACGGAIKSVFLVGGYAASPWLFNQLQERLAPLDVTVSRPDTQTSKAVADGAIGFYCDHHVSARMSKFMYGVEFLRALDPQDPDHVARQGKLCELPSGPKLLPDAFDCILARGVKVKESTVFTRKYCTELTSLSMLRVFEVEIWCYRGGNTVPKWINRRADDFSTLCVVKADLSMLSDSAAPKNGKNGKTYWTIVFSVEIHFGLTEFKARIKWLEDGKTKYGPATIVYNERGHRTDEDEPDFYPEDDAPTTSSTARADRNRSEPSSRARTPTEPQYVDSSRRSSQVPPPLSGIPDVTRAPTSKAISASSPSTPSKSPYPSLDKDYDPDRRKSVDKGKERDRDRDRERDRDKSVPPTPIERTRSSKNSTLGGTTKPTEAHSPIWGGGPSHPTTPAVPAVTASTPSAASRKSKAPSTPGLEYVDPPAAFSSPAKGEPSALWDPVVHDPQDPISNTHAVEGDRPRSIFGGTPKSIFGEDPKSAFGTPKSVFGAGGASGHTPKSVFGEVDQSKSLFGDSHDVLAAPSVFGEPASAMFDNPPGGADHLWKEPEAAAGDTWDNWGAVASTDSPKTKSGKGKTPTGSGGVSRNSPAFGGGKSPFGGQNNFDSFAESSASPVAGLLGSKAPSPNTKPLSPLNPAARQDDAWGWNDNIGGNANGGASAAVDDVSAPVAPVTPVFEEVRTPVEETPATTPGGKKKKKKGAAATTPGKAATALALEKEEEERKAKEESDRLEKEEKEKERRAREEKEQFDREERERQEWEREEQLRFEKEENERIEKERKEMEENDRKERVKLEKEREEKDRKEKERLEKEEKKKREKEEKERKKLEEEEKARKKKEDEDEKARKKKEEVEEKARKKREEEEEKSRKKKEEDEEKAKKKKEADEEKAKKKKEADDEKARKKKEADDEKARKQKEEEETQERLRQEEEWQRLEKEKADAERLEREQLDAEEKKLQTELQELEKEEQERKEKGKKDNAIFSSFDSGPVSMFGNSAGGLFSGSSLEPPKQPWTSTSTEEKEDSGFSGGWGSFGSKKKSKATTPVASSPLAVTPSKFGFSFNSAFDDPYSNPAAAETSNVQESKSSFFDGVNLQFDNIDMGGDQAAATAIEEAAGKIGETEMAGGEDNAVEDDAWGPAINVGKKKKKGKNNNALEPPPAPNVEEPEATATAGGGESKEGEFDDLLDDLMGDNQEQEANEQDFGMPAKNKKKKKGKAGEDISTPVDSEIPKVEEPAGATKKKKKKK